MVINKMTCCYLMTMTIQHHDAFHRPTQIRRTRMILPPRTIRRRLRRRPTIRTDPPPTTSRCPTIRRRTRSGSVCPIYEEASFLVLLPRRRASFAIFDRSSTATRACRRPLGSCQIYPQSSAAQAVLLVVPHRPHGGEDARTMMSS